MPAEHIVTQTRTPEAILAHYNAVKADDWLGVIAEDLLPRLPFEMVKQWLREDLTAETYEQEQWTPETVIEEMCAYMPFAWKKAHGERGISAGRSIQHFESWVWLLGPEYDDLYDFLRNQDNYPQYGKPMLRAICERFGFEVQS